MPLQITFSTLALNAIHLPLSEILKQYSQIHFLFIIDTTIFMLRKFSLKVIVKNIIKDLKQGKIGV